MSRKRSIVSEDVLPAQLPEKLLTLEEVQQRLQVGRKQVLYLIAHEGLPCMDWGHRTKRVHPDALAKWLAKQTAL